MPLANKPAHVPEIKVTFNFKLFFLALGRMFWRTKGTHARLTMKRVLVILVLFPVYVVVEIFNWLGFLLDEVLFPGYRRQPVREPVFIVGAWRSGTTLLHRLMEQDTTQFTSMKMWEIFLAPSIVQKKLFRLLGRVDSVCGGPLFKLAIKIESRLFRTLNRFHHYSLFAADEDEMLMLHRFSSLYLIIMFPFVDLLRPYVHFDRELDAREKSDYLRFYRRCVQKHLYVFGRDKHFLSKNPFFSGMIQSLGDTFPDAKFICIVRAPTEGIPSSLSMWTSFFTVLLSPLNDLPLLGELRKIIAHYYRSPLEKLDAMRPDRQQVVRYDDLVRHLNRVLHDIYMNFGLVMTPIYAQMLQCEEGRVRGYESQHKFMLERFGLTRTALREEYTDIYDRFEFDLDSDRCVKA